MSSTPQLETQPEVGYAGRARVPTPKISRVAEIKDNEYLKDLPPRYTIRRFYLPSEVASHCTSDDCWVSLFNQVFDLTKLIAENFESPLCDPLVLAAGSDVTHWFNSANREPKTYIDPETNLETPYCP
jgi:cytochrome b involved in lipid metabolism